MLNYIREVRIMTERIEDNEIYPFNIGALRSTDTIRFDSSITFFSGENGSGKSTLIEAIATAYGFNPEGGNKNILFSTNETHSSLHEYLWMNRGVYHAEDGFFLRAESFYNLATKIDEIGDGIHSFYGNRSLHTVSHGESFLNLILYRFGGNGLYILDEPEAALSPTGQFTLLRKIHDLATKEHSQFIIATHSPILMACPDAKIYEFDEDGIHEKQYHDTMNYALYHRFLNDPNMIKRLLEEDS